MSKKVSESKIHTSRSHKHCCFQRWQSCPAGNILKIYRGFLDFQNSQAWVFQVKIPVFILSFQWLVLYITVKTTYSFFKKIMCLSYITYGFHGRIEKKLSSNICYKNGELSLLSMWTTVLTEKWQTEGCGQICPVGIFVGFLQYSSKF